RRPQSRGGEGGDHPNPAQQPQGTRPEAPHQHTHETPRYQQDSYLRRPTTPPTHPVLRVLLHYASRLPEMNLGGSTLA
ncbi:hypothetical protein, partial [Nocardiopsis sp. JB363]|uniref:hypothetical protein n=1 Tax=Nocardiopsis sp. JB363 TaxID=1434837 RepID=UPI001F19287A